MLLRSFIVISCWWRHIAIFYLKSGAFIFPSEQIVRAVFFGVVAGTAISLYMLVTTFLGRFKNKISMKRKDGE